MTTLAFITNLAGPQGWIILLIVVLLFGAKKLPELGRSLGQTMKEFQKSKEENEAEEAERTRLAQEKSKHP